MQTLKEHEKMYWSKYCFLDMIDLFVAAISLLENALNPMKYKILYSYYIISSSVMSNYMKRSFKFTLVQAL